MYRGRHDDDEEGLGMGSRGPLKLAPSPGEGRVTVPETVASVVPALAPSKPKGILADEELSTLWDEVVPQLDAAGLVSPADGPAVEIMLRHVIVARMAHREIMETGTVIVPSTDTGVDKKHPAEAVLRLESAVVMEWSKQLGMTWMSRARTAAPARKDGEDGNPFSATEAAS